MIGFDPGPPLDFTARFEGSLHIVGGTGRFLTARTEADRPIALSGTFQFLAERIALKLDGWFLYEAGEREL